MERKKNRAGVGVRGNLRKYLSRNPLRQFFIFRFLTKIRKIIRQLPSGSICEIGCGEGFILREMFPHNDQCVVGLDIDQRALEFASEHRTNASLVCGSVYQLPFKAKRFNNLMLLEVLEHLEYPKRALDEAARTGDMLLVSVPHEPFFQIANFLSGKNFIRWGNDIEHVQHWNKKSFYDLLKDYGTIVSLETSFPWLIALVKISDTVKID